LAPLRGIFYRFANLLISLSLKVLQEFRGLNANRDRQILWGVLLKPVAFVPEIGDTLLERRNRCLLIHEEPVRALGTFRFRLQLSRARKGVYLEDLDFDVVGFEAVIVVCAVAEGLVAGASAPTVRLHYPSIDND
jgi:hypothetical protein